jgi:Ca2+-binding RTX toxin-like protein
VIVDNSGSVSGTFGVVPGSKTVSSVTVSASSTETITQQCQLTTPGTTKVITKTATFTAIGQQTFSNVANNQQFSVQTTAFLLSSSLVLGLSINKVC